MSVWGDTPLPPGGFPSRAFDEWLTRAEWDGRVGDEDHREHPRRSEWVYEMSRARVQPALWVEAFDRLGFGRRGSAGAHIPWERLTDADLDRVRAEVRALSMRPTRGGRAVLDEARVVAEQQIRGSGEGDGR